MAATGSAVAHASLLRSTPVDGSVLVAPPLRFVLTFNEPVSPIVMRLVEADGTGSDLAQIQAHDETIVVTPPPIKNGTHALSWRVISADGHPIGGSIVFSVGEATAAGIVVQTNTLPTLTALIWSARLVLYFGLFVGIGGAFFATWIAEGRPLPQIAERVMIGCLIAGLASTILSLGLQGVDVLGADLTQLSNLSTWHAGLISSYAVTLVVAAGALLLALMSRWITSLAGGRAISAVALVAIGAALTLSGHASTAPPQVLTRPAIFIHGISIAFWVGSLVPLATLIPDDGLQAASTLKRFSQTIPFAVALLVASGVLLAVVQLGRVNALWTTTYGPVLDAKLAAVVILLGLAARNRFSLTPSVKAGGAVARRAMVRSIVVEVALVATILGLVATWRFTPPPRVSTAVSAVAFPVPVHIRGAVLVHSREAKAIADMVITPGKVGPSSVALLVLNGQFGPIDAKGITLTLSNPTAGVQPIKREARHVEGANWTVDLLTIPAAGKWISKVDILVSDFEEITLQGEFDVPR